MIAYLDTHIAMRLLHGDGRKMTREAKRVIQRASLRISPVVLLELEYLSEIGRTRLAPMDIAAKLATQMDVTLCDFSFPLIAQAALHEKWTRDTFDRLIVAHARANGVSALISADERVRANYSATVW